MALNQIFAKRKNSWILVALALFAAVVFPSPSQADVTVTKATKNLPPNAYYYYLKALDVKHQAALTNHTPPPPPPDTKRTKQENSEPYYKKNAAEIKADAEALEIVRQGFAFKYERNQSLSDIANGANMSFSSGMRQIARLLAKESDARAAKGDWEGAANSAVDGIRLGQDISHGTIINMLVGRSIQAITIKSLYQTLDHVDAATAREVVNRLTKILSQKVQYADALQAEKRVGMFEYKKMAASNDWQKEYPSKKSVVELKSIYIRAMDKLITSARLPYPQRKTSISKPDDSLNQTMLGLYSDPEYLKLGSAQGLGNTKQRTQNLFVLVEFALRAYKLEHGEYPGELDALTPDYLQEVPRDPFAANQSLRYKANEKTYILYSIGPDGKDDGGERIKEGYVPPNTKGDWVAGVKNW